VTHPPTSSPGWPAPDPAAGSNRPDDRPEWLSPPPGGTPPAGPGWPAGSGWSPAQPPPPRPGRRVGLVTAVVILLLVIGLAAGGLVVATRREQPPAAGATAGGAPATSAPTPRTPSTRAPAAGAAAPAGVREVQRAVAELRGLRFTRRVPVTVETPEKLSRRLLRILAAETDRAELVRLGRTMELLGQLPPGTDLPGLLHRIRSESTLGFYLPGRPPKGGLYVRSTRGVDPFARYVLAHELTHAVTDQNYDLTHADRLDAATGREDELAAYTALLEGDATLTAQLYVTERLTMAEKVALAQTAASQANTGRDAAPAVIRESLAFPYQEGLRFVRRLYQQGGWAAVDRAYRDPPTSTEQLLHPERYLSTRDRPQAVAIPDLSGRLGAGWRPGVEVSFGEFDARLLLQEQLPVTAAEAAAAGWDGGRLRSFQRGGHTALALRTVWDSSAEADQFCAAMSRWAGARFGQGTRAAAGTVRWSGAGQHTALTCRGPRVAWFSAPDRPALDRLVTGTGGP
jgi:hypothetical protein